MKSWWFCLTGRKTGCQRESRATCRRQRKQALPCAAKSRPGALPDYTVSCELMPSHTLLHEWDCLHLHQEQTASSLLTCTPVMHTRALLAFPFSSFLFFNTVKVKIHLTHTHINTQSSILTPSYAINFKSMSIWRPGLPVCHFLFSSIMTFAWWHIINPLLPTG